MISYTSKKEWTIYKNKDWYNCDFKILKDQIANII